MQPRFPPAIFLYSWRFLLGLQHLKIVKIGQIWRKSNETREFNIYVYFYSERSEVDNRKNIVCILLLIAVVLE